MSEIMEIRQLVRLNQWSAMVQEREDSGLSVKAFCVANVDRTVSVGIRQRELSGGIVILFSVRLISMALGLSP